MADLKKLAQGQKAFARTAKGKPAAAEKKPQKSLEETSNEEVGELEAAFRERIAKEEKRVAALDTEFWFCVYFASREAKENFLREHGFSRIGDKYLDGRAVDRVLKMRSGAVARDAHRDNRGQRGSIGQKENRKG